MDMLKRIPTVYFTLNTCFIDICLHVTMILSSFTYSLLTPFLFSCFMLVHLFLVPD